MENAAFADRLRNGEPVIGAWSPIGNQVVTEVLAGMDFDFIVIDAEHSERTIESVARSIRAVEAVGNNTAAVVRVSGVDRAEIKRMLDLGPEGVIVPQIETVAEAQEAVAASRYPPKAVRGVAGSRASGYGTELETYVKEANRKIATILQVETESLVESIDEVVRLEGMDALFIGHADLSARLGCFGDFSNDRFKEAIDRVVEVAGEAEVPVGTIATDLDAVRKQWEWGANFMALGTDIGYLRIGANQFLDRFEEIQESTID